MINNEVQRIFSGDSSHVNKILPLNVPVFQPRCLNYSHFVKGCYLLSIPDKNLLVNKKDLIKKCDGFKLSSECCWFKDIDYADYL